ncbi:MAG: TetR/AcrR family transcriptional regulator [Thermoproteota archaeon]|nr:TetR/AcrR family transcriptional regulator [Thermoproteota archaeon]
MHKKITPRDKTELREKIMQSAMENFAKHGFDRTRMEDIATAAGLAKGTLYLYFKNKEDLFYAICDHNLEELRNQLSRLFNRKENIMLDAERFYDEYQRGSLGGDTIWFEMIALSTRSPKLKKIVAENQRQVYQVVKEFLKKQIDRGFLTEDTNIDIVASTLIALYNGLVVNKLLLQTTHSESQKAWVETIRALVGMGATKQ